MAKASPMVRSFNAGEFSSLLEGRVDLERYASSAHVLLNTIAAPQGPSISRSGTAFVAEAAKSTAASALIPFVFSNTESFVLEFTTDRMRILTEDGLQVYDAVQLTLTNLPEATIAFDAVGLDAEIGDQIFLSGFPAEYGLNGRVANIVTKNTNSYTIDVVHPAEPVFNGQGALVYSVPCDYSEVDRAAIRYIQSVNVMYLLSSTRPRRLSRFGPFDWRIEDIEFQDGPYLDINEGTTTLTPSDTGNAVVVMSSNTSGGAVASGSGVHGGNDFYLAFDADDTTFWESATDQTGTLQYTPPTAFVCDGYTIYAAKNNVSANYTDIDYAPSSFSFEGFDGTDWIVLDSQENYVFYENNKSAFFELKNETAYQAYRIVIAKCTRNGPLKPRIRRLVMRQDGNLVSSFNLTASATSGINSGSGFLTSDVGRLVRLRGSDASWRACRITSWTSTTAVQVKLLGEPLTDTRPIRFWRLGYWSDTTGWPTCGGFFEDRLFLMGSTVAPDLVAGSVTADYERFSPTDAFGEVLDDSGVAVRLNSPKLSKIQWMSADARGILVGTGSEEYTVSAPDRQALTARNIRARPATSRGSADVAHVRVDNQNLFVQRGGRALREIAFVFEADDYRAPSMSQLASHLGAVPFVAMDYAQEPHAIVWVRRADNSVVGLTYNRDENVVGWHRHDFSGARVESIAVVPQRDQLQDALWLSCVRTVNGQERRYIERLTQFWDFSTPLSEAHFVDSALRYTGPLADKVFGLEHLEGEEVYGLADTKPIGPLVVQNGQVELAFAAENIIVGLGYDSEGVVPRLNNGAADGTAQGKVKRINRIVVNVWRSFGGEIGVYNEETGEYIYEPLEYPARFDRFDDPEIYTGKIGPLTPAPGYDMDGRIAFRRPKHSTLPFNVLAIMPQLNTQDR